MGLGAGAAAKVAGAGVLVLFLCWQHVQATRLGYQVESARKEARERRGRVAALRLEFDERLSPAEVASRATRLGLIPAAPDALRRLPGREEAPTGFARLWSRRAAPATPARS